MTEPRWIAREYHQHCPYGPDLPGQCGHHPRDHDYTRQPYCTLNACGWEVYDQRDQAVDYRNSLKAPVQRMVNRRNREAR